MGQAPDDIRQDIEDTRERMSEKADALAYKADVPARAKDRVDDAKESVMTKVHEVTDKVTGKAQEAQELVSGKASEAQDRVRGSAGHGADEARHRVRQASGAAQGNPLGLAFGAAAVGFLAGLLIPTSRTEHERLGAAGEQIRDRAKEMGKEAVDRGRQVAETTKEAAKESVKGQAGEARDEHTGTSVDMTGGNAAEGTTENRPAHTYATP